VVIVQDTTYIIALLYEAIQDESVLYFP